MLTVSDLLNTEPFKLFKIVSGFNGLNNKISGVNIMDNPDALDWFSPEEVLLSSGYFFKDNKFTQDSIFKKLKIMNCSALIIEPTNYLGKIPNNMIALSDELSIPIIEIPYGISFPKVMTRVMKELSDSHDLLNSKSLDIHNQFFELTLHGEGLQKISDVLSTMLEASIFLCDPDWNILKSTETLSYSKSFGIDGFDNIFFSESFTDSLPLNIKKIQNPIVRLLEINNIEVPFIIIPTFFNNIHYGYIVALQFNKTLKNYHYIALESGSMAFALERAHLEEIKRTHNRIRENFFDELLAGKITSLPTLKNLADLHEIDLNLMYTAFVFDLSFQHFNSHNIIKNTRYEENTEKFIVDSIKNFPLNKNINLFVFIRKKQVIILVGIASEESLANIKDIKKNIEVFINNIEKKYTNCSVYCGIGNISKQLLDIKLSFFEAQETLRSMRNEPIQKKVYHYNDFFISNFFKKNIDHEELVMFFTKTLGPLYSFDKKNNSKLITTLECLIKNQLNIAETARELYIHRNSLLYRIEKIQGILASDFKDPDEILKIQIAIRIYYILNQNNDILTNPELPFIKNTHT